MKAVMRLLVIEDSEADFLLVRRNLKQHGVEADYHRVDNLQDLELALDAGGWDAILSDYNVPGMDFRASLALLKQRVPDLPVILVSGSIGEEMALDLLRSGLSDFVLKDRPTRLAGALHHSLEAAQVLKAQRIAEAALLESESRFAIMFRSNPLGIGVSKFSDAKFVEVNEALLELLQMSREDLIGQTAVEAGLFLYPGDRDRMIAQVKERGRVRNFQFQFRGRDGALRDMLMSGERILLGGEAYLLGMVSDITPLRTAERSLQASEGRYRSLFENMSEGFAHCRWIHEEGGPDDWEYLAVNPAYEQVTGFRDVVGRRLSEVIPRLREDNPELFDTLGGVASTGVPAKFETFIPDQGRWLAVSAYRPAPGEFVVMLDNITDRKEAEAALKASQTRFQAVFNASPAGIVLSQPGTGQIIDANPAFQELVGFGLDEMRGRSSIELGLWVNPADREEAIRQLQNTGRVRHMDAELRTRSGEVVSVFWSTEQVELGGERVLVNLIQDETARRKAEDDRRRLEAEVAHAQKLESLGALAGGVSHDMNNVLGAVMSLGSALKEKHKNDPSLSKSMDVLLHAAGRGRDLVKGLTDFARKDVSEPRPLNLNEVVRKESALLTRTTLQKVQVELDLEEGLPYVLGDESSISNALMNLSVNALDAMPGGGRLVLRTWAGPGGQVALTVQDNGSGMPPEVLQRAMEPFFTTKPTGKGTGLGLALVYGIMKAHAGRVEIQSAPGQGTEITLSFPSLATNAAWTAAHPQPAEGPASHLRILLVDDDDLIRSTVPDMLEVLGHEVEAVSSGPEAIQRVQSGPIPDLVILDLSMPGMDGEETLTRLRGLKRDLPVLLATGYKDERHERILEHFSDVGVITKPFTIMDLRVKLAQMR
ncbi:PAS domain S-box protein [Geothrix sp. PMB-07]|uniref:hybrid sensor histidine kinase/response regulator n=1 Tax=Geothrix sp. PMB-07 TaxID=3068640 RepID=UPI0027423F8C|nr:PAS domain S-box protein [Geothrix sp. PMB-07]WLT31246.1 PAS domain S-box protein [Geothrix sp. PMB-07]